MKYTKITEFILTPIENQFIIYCDEIRFICLKINGQIDRLALLHVSIPFQWERVITASEKTRYNVAFVRIGALILYNWVRETMERIIRTLTRNVHIQEHRTEQRNAQSKRLLMCFFHLFFNLFPLPLIYSELLRARDGKKYTSVNVILRVCRLGCLLLLLCMCAYHLLQHYVDGTAHSKCSVSVYVNEIQKNNTIEMIYLSRASIIRIVILLRIYRTLHSKYYAASAKSTSAKRNRQIVCIRINMVWPCGF